MRSYQLSLCVVLLLAALLPAYASGNLDLIRSADLKNELCDAKAQQVNSPLSGVDFISDNEVLIYTVCREGVALSRRDRFQATDPNHLKTVVLDLATGAVKQRFDWPTHGHDSSISVTHAGDLLVRRDNLLQLLSPDGEPFARLRIRKEGPNNSMLLALSPAVDAMAVAVSFSAPDGHMFSGIGILDSRSLHLLTRWEEYAELWSIAASPLAAARTAGAGPQLDVRDFKSGNWKTIARSSDRSIFHPLFVSNSEFAVPAENTVELFDISGNSRGLFGCPHAVKAAVSRDGRILAAMCVPDSVGAPSILPEFGAQFGMVTFQIYALSPQELLGSVNEPMSPAFRYDFALSPSGSRLAVVDNLKVSVYEVPSP
jgi:hypothetical protein